MEPKLNFPVKPAAKKSSKSGKEEIVNEKSKSPKKVKEEKVKSLKAINNKDSDKNSESCDDDEERKDWDFLGFWCGTGVYLGISLWMMSIRLCE